MKKRNVAAAILFCGFLIIMAAGYLLPKQAFSEMEKRYLAEKPDFRLETVSSGQWSREAEDYLSDHVPGRNLLVGVHAYMELLAGRQHLKDVWLEEGKLLEAPVAVDAQAIARNMKAINTLAERLAQEIHVMVVPSAGWAAGVEGYTDDASLEAIYAAAGELVESLGGAFDQSNLGSVDDNAAHRVAHVPLPAQVVVAVVIARQNGHIRHGIPATPEWASDSDTQQSCHHAGAWTGRHLPAQCGFSWPAAASW